MLPISVCMIVKNEEKRLPVCLDSLRPYGFEIVIVDTGSADKTKEVAARYTDKLFDFAWCGDFSTARNYSLRMASNPFIFMLDADEWVVSLDVEELQYFRKRLSAQVGVVTRQNFIGGQIGNTDPTERFFSRKHYHYEGRIHEQLRPLRGNDFPCLLTKTIIGHSGYDMTDAERAEKAKRNEELLLLELADITGSSSLESHATADLQKDASAASVGSPADPAKNKEKLPYLYYQLGKTAEMTAASEKAAAYYEKGLSFPLDASLAYVEDMVIRYGSCLLLAGRLTDALGVSALKEDFSQSADYAYLLGMIYQRNAMYADAVKEYARAMRLPAGRLAGVNDALPRERLAEIERALRS